MLTSELQNNVNNYISIYTELKKQLKWKIAHEGLLMLTASAYIVNKREFDFRRFYGLSNYIKANVGMFSTLNSHHRFTIASILDIHFQDKAKEQFRAFSDLYEDMLKQGFKRDIFTYLSALIVLTGKSEQKNSQRNHVRRFIHLSADEAGALFPDINSKLPIRRNARWNRQRKNRIDETSGIFLSKAFRRRF